MFAWLDELLKMFVDFVPRPLIVRPDEEVVMFVLGRYIFKLKPGWYVDWPLFTRHEVVPVRRDVLNREQKFFHDGRTLAYKWKVVYEVADSIKLAIETYNYVETISDVTEIVFAQLWHENDPEDLLAPTHAEIIRSKIDEQLETFGVKVLQFQITSYSVVRPISVWEMFSRE